MPTRAMNRRAFVECSSGSGGFREPAVLCAPRPRRVQVHPCSADLILGPPPFLLNISSNTTTNKNNNNKEGKTKPPEIDGDADGVWGLFGGSPPARADNPLVHDPHFLLNQRHHSPSELGIFDHHLSRDTRHRPTYLSSNNSSSFAPAVRVQGFDVAACRSSSRSDSGGRVLSARA